MNKGSVKSKLIIAAVAVVLILATALAVKIHVDSGVYLDSGVGGKTRFDAGSKEIDISGMGLDDVSALYRCKNLEKLDIRGNNITPEQYRELESELEGCEILWDIPFQGEKYDCSTESLTLSGLTDEDIDTIGLFASLKSVDARQCGDLEKLLELRGALPDSVGMAINAFGKDIDGSTDELDLEGCSLGGTEELSAVLSLNPQIKKTGLTGSGLSNEDMISLRNSFPGAGIHWDFEFFGKTVSTVENEIDISNRKVSDLDAFRGLLNCFESVEKLVMCDCKLSNEDMEKLCGEYPNIRFVWRVYLGSWNLRTDAKYFCTNINQPNMYQLKSADIEVLKYCTDLEHLDIGHSYVTDISALAGLTKLKTLIIASGGEGVTDISPLAGMVHMQYLELFLNHISDISPLANMHELLDLNMVFNNVSDITPLLGLDQLERCWIARNEISEEDMERLQKELPKCEFNFTVWAATDGHWRHNERYFEMREYFGFNPEKGREEAHCPRPYDVQPENYLTHYNAYYKGAVNY